VAVGHSRMSRIESIVKGLIKDMLYNRGSRVVDRRVTGRRVEAKLGWNRPWPDPDVRPHHAPAGFMADKDKRAAEAVTMRLNTVPSTSFDMTAYAKVAMSIANSWDVVR
jgi:hypothetical protein